MSCDGCQQLPDFPCMAAGQKQTLVADFGQFLPPGVTLTGSPTVTSALAASNQGADSNPSARLIGSAVVITPSRGTDLANTGIAQQFLPLGGVTYVLTWTCPRSDGDVAAGYNHVFCAAPA